VADSFGPFAFSSCLLPRFFFVVENYSVQVIVSLVNTLIIVLTCIISIWMNCNGFSG
jgi:hypothetical protein